MPLKQISMSDLHRTAPQLGAAEIILDVRTNDEYAAGHVKGSLNIPHDQLSAHLKDLKRYKTIYIHCRSGKRAAFAAQILLTTGFTNLVCVAGSGMDDWVAAGFPIEKA